MLVYLREVFGELTWIVLRYLGLVCVGCLYSGGLIYSDPACFIGVDG
jgi:hypothetical protein